MKILIWVHKNDVLANKILTYHFTRPIIDRHDQYLQVEITQDEFARLEDKKYSNIEISSVDGCDHPPIETPTPPCNDKNITYPEFRDKYYNKSHGKDWITEQYNRNREHKDQIK